MKFEIIDFHTHPFVEPENNICAHKEYCGMNVDNTIEVFKELGISKICGSVISFTEETEWSKIKRNNDTALKLKEVYGDFYVPGFLYTLFTAMLVNAITAFVGARK